MCVQEENEFTYHTDKTMTGSGSAATHGKTSQKSQLRHTADMASTGGSKMTMVRGKAYISYMLDALHTQLALRYRPCKKVHLGLGLHIVCICVCVWTLVCDCSCPHYKEVQDNCLAGCSYHHAQRMCSLQTLVCHSLVDSLAR